MTVIAFIVVLSILVIVHEWGHFQVARWCGIKVETFSIGFGPQIASFERGDTTYRIAAIPLGGYVKMLGDEPGEEDAERPDAYYAQPIRKRAAVVIAGPAMNIFLAFALAPLMYLLGVPEPSYLTEEAEIGWISGELIADTMVSGDVVRSVDGQKIQTWRELQNALAISQGQLTLELERQGKILITTLDSPKPGAILEHILPPMDTRIEKVLPDSAAGEAELQQGDSIAAIGGQSVSHWMGIRSALDRTEGRPVSVAINRGGSIIEKTIAPRMNENGDYLLGIARQEQTIMRRYGIGQSIQMGTARVMDMFGLTFQVLGRLFTGKLGVDALGGPLMIAQGAGDAARQGAGALITFMIFISIQLGVLNLLPIPVLDGGHLLLMGAEAVYRRRLPEKAIAAAQYAGFGAMMVLILYVTRNDIMRIWGSSINSWLNGG